MNHIDHGHRALLWIILATMHVVLLAVGGMPLVHLPVALVSTAAFAIHAWRAL